MAAMIVAILIDYSTVYFRGYKFAMYSRASPTVIVGKPQIMEVRDQSFNSSAAASPSTMRIAPRTAQTYFFLSALN